MKGIRYTAEFKAEAIKQITERAISSVISNWVSLSSAVPGWLPVFASSRVALGVPTPVVTGSIVPCVPFPLALETPLDTPSALAGCPPVSTTPASSDSLLLSLDCSVRRSLVVLPSGICSVLVGLAFSFSLFLRLVLRFQSCEHLIQVCLHYIVRFQSRHFRLLACWCRG